MPIATTHVPAPRAHPRAPRRMLARSSLATIAALGALAPACAKTEAPSPTATTAGSATTAAAGTSTTLGTRPGTAPPSTATTSTNTAPTSAPPVTAAPTTRPDERPAPFAGGDTEPKRGPFAGDATTHLTAVRAARHDGFDRVVFEFEGAVPGFQVAYTEPPILQDASGEPIAVAGRAFLEARFEPASGVDLSGAELREVYTGPKRIAPGTTNVTEIVQTGDFEAVLHWVLGCRSRTAFRVTTLTAPSRVVIDVAH